MSTSRSLKFYIAYWHFKQRASGAKFSIPSVQCCKYRLTNIAEIRDCENQIPVTHNDIFDRLEALLYSRTVFLNRGSAARYRALASIIPARERLCKSHKQMFYFVNILRRIIFVNVSKTQTQMLGWGNYNTLQNFFSPVFDN